MIILDLIIQLGSYSVDGEANLILDGNSSIFLSISYDGCCDL